MWINKAKYEKEKQYIETLKNNFNSVQTELQRLKSKMPYADLLVATPYSELRRIAHHVYGMHDEYIEKTCANKADLIFEILEAKKKLEEISVEHRKECRG